MVHTERELNFNCKPDEKVESHGICGHCNVISVELENGSLRIFKNLVDLREGVELQSPYHKHSIVRKCTQCTCAEIIAGYPNGMICAWDIESGILKDKI